jgi:hypothetical protein
VTVIHPIHITAWVIEFNILKPEENAEVRRLGRKNIGCLRI